MKFFIVIFSLILSTARIVSAQHLMTDREFEGMKGKPHTIQFTFEDLLNDPNPAPEYRRKGNTLSYDEAGNLIGRIELSTGYTRTLEVKHPNAQTAIFAHATDWGAAKKGDVAEKHEYKFDDKGRRIEDSLSYGDEPPAIRTVYHYDSKGNIDEEEWYGDDPKKPNRLQHRFDERGNLVEETGEINIGSRQYKKLSYTYRFDPQGNWTEKTITGEVEENGKTRTEPFERLFREINYYNSK